MDSEQISKIKGFVKETGYLQSLHIYIDTDSGKGYDLEIVLSTYPYYEGEKRLKLTFYEFSGFQLGNINNFDRVSLEIVDVSDRQLERIKYYVNELGHNMVSFSCFDIKYELI